MISVISVVNFFYTLMSVFCVLNVYLILYGVGGCPAALKERYGHITVYMPQTLFSIFTMRKKQYFFTAKKTGRGFCLLVFCNTTHSCNLRLSINFAVLEFGLFHGYNIVRISAYQSEQRWIEVMEINLKEKIRTLRQQKNVTQEALANHLGITPQSVGKWERGVSHS